MVRARGCLSVYVREGAGGGSSGHDHSVEPALVRTKHCHVADAAKRHLHERESCSHTHALMHTRMVTHTEMRVNSHTRIH